MDVNYRAAITIAEAAPRHGVRNYVFKQLAPDH